MINPLLGLLGTAVLLGLAGLLLYAFFTALVLPKTRGAMFVGTSRQRIRAALEVLEIPAGAKVVDLGCGDGRLLRAVWRCWRVEAVGYEINPLAYFLSRILNFLARVPVEVRWEDFFKVNLGAYDVIFCYLFPDVMPRLSEKLRQEARPGTVVVSFNFSLPGFQPFRVLRVGEPIYFYRL